MYNAGNIIRYCLHKAVIIPNVMKKFNFLYFFRKSKMVLDVAKCGCWRSSTFWYLHAQQALGYNADLLKFPNNPRRVINMCHNWCQLKKNDLKKLELDVAKHACCQRSTFWYTCVEQALGYNVDLLKFPKNRPFLNCSADCRQNWTFCENFE